MGAPVKNDEAPESVARNQSEINSQSGQSQEPPSQDQGCSVDSNGVGGKATVHNTSYAVVCTGAWSQVSLEAIASSSRNNARTTRSEDPETFIRKDGPNRPTTPVQGQTSDVKDTREGKN